MTRWSVICTCFRCHGMNRCYSDDEHWLCRSCFNDMHGFDPLVCEWPA